MEGKVLDASAASAEDCDGMEFTSAAACPGVTGVGMGASCGGGEETSAGVAAKSRFTIGEDRAL